MNDLKISKGELLLLLNRSITKLTEDSHPGQNPEKEKSVNFLKEFAKIFEDSKVDYVPLSEVISLLVLENQATQQALRDKLRKSLQISNLSIKIRQTAESNPQEVPELVKIFDQLIQTQK